MKRTRVNMLDRITGILLNRCGIHQHNVYNNSDHLVTLGKIEPDHPLVYRFVKHTRVGKFLERRWVRNTHKRISKIGEEECLNLPS